MGSENHSPVPTVTLMLNAVRRVSRAEAHSIVLRELGQDAAQTVRVVNEDRVGMCYIDWKVGPTCYHIGTSSDPYLPVFGTARIDGDNKVIGQVKWTMREEVPPEDPECCEAWMSHVAWVYVDALVFTPYADREAHLRNVLRISSHFVDERCLLIWLYGGEPKRVALPTPRTVAALRAGEWPT